MSRETDVKALKQLKNDMLEAAAYAKLSKGESERGHEYRREIENTKFVFNQDYGTPVIPSFRTWDQANFIS